MPIISRFFGIIVRMFYDEHNPPHIHVEYSNYNAVFDFSGNIIKGDLKSRTATKLVRDWIDIRIDALNQDWELARKGEQIQPVEPLG